MERQELIQVKIELGHKAWCRKQPTRDGFTHDWVMFVRGPDNSDVSHFVEKVVFFLHESFSKPKRVVKEPPYKLEECGYGSFHLPLEVHFKNREEPKKVFFEYDLLLPALGLPPVSNIRSEALTFKNPTDEFKRKVLKAGGVIITNANGYHSTPISSPVSTNGGQVISAGKTVLKKSSSAESSPTTEASEKTPAKKLKLDKPIKSKLSNRPNESALPTSTTLASKRPADMDSTSPPVTKKKRNSPESSSKSKSVGLTPESLISVKEEKEDRKESMKLKLKTLAGKANGQKIEKGEKRMEKGEKRPEKGEKKIEKGEKKSEKVEKKTEKGDKLEKGEKKTEKGEKKLEKGEKKAEKGEKKKEKGEKKKEKRTLMESSSTAKRKDSTSASKKVKEKLVKSPETELKSTPKSEAKLTPKSEGKLTPKSETKSTSKSEAKLTPKSEIKPTPKYEAKLSAKTESKSILKAESKTPKKERKLSSKSTPKISMSTSKLSKHDGKSSIASESKPSSNLDFKSKHLKKEERILGKLTFRRNSNESWSSSASSSSSLLSGGPPANGNKNNALGTLIAELDSDDDDDDDDIDISTPYQSDFVKQGEYAQPAVNSNQLLNHNTVNGTNNNFIKSTETGNMNKNPSSLQNGKYESDSRKHGSDRSMGTSEIRESHLHKQSPRTKPKDEKLTSNSGKTIPSDLLILHKKLSSLRDSASLQKVADILETTGSFAVTETSLKFDLCTLDKETIRKIEKCVNR